MRRIVLLLLAALVLSPAYGDGKEVKEWVSYLGQGQFTFDKKPYGYKDLVAALQAAHPDEHIDMVVVDMGTVAGQGDKNLVCQLRQALQTQVKMKLTVDDGKRELFCN